MRFVPGPARFHLPHHNAPSWPSVVLSFEEAERHLRRLKRLPCGCMRYGGFTSRPTARVYLEGDISCDVKVQRVMATLSVDRPLGASDFACHRCDQEWCCNPDHLYRGTFLTNRRDKLRPGRPIRERQSARFYDAILAEIAEAPALMEAATPRKVGRPLGYIPDPLPVRIAAAPPPVLSRIIPPPRPIMQVQPTAW